jgi:transketolase
MLYLAGQGIAVRQFRHLYAKAHHFERYGSQTFLRKQSSLDAHSMLTVLESL